MSVFSSWASPIGGGEGPAKARTFQGATVTSILGTNPQRAEVQAALEKLAPLTDKFVSDRVSRVGSASLMQQQTGGKRVSTL